MYHTLRTVLKGKEWEYALVVEKHRSGYGHVHCAVFVDGAVTEAEFRPVIDAHLRKCEIAGADAHDYHSPNEDDRPISVKRIDPTAGEAEQGEAVANLGSYIGEYIGAYGEALFDRGLDELIFRAAAWATGTQIVRFSKGANELIERDRGAPLRSHRRRRFDRTRRSTPRSTLTQTRTSLRSRWRIQVGRSSASPGRTVTMSRYSSSIALASSGARSRTHPNSIHRGPCLRIDRVSGHDPRISRHSNPTRKL